MTRLKKLRLANFNSLPELLFYDDSRLFSWIGWQLLLATKPVAVPECDLLPPNGEVREEQAVVLLRPDGGK